MPQINVTNILELASKEGSLLALFPNRIAATVKQNLVPIVNFSSLGADYVLDTPSEETFVVGGVALTRRTLSRWISITDETVEDTDGIVSTSLAEKAIAEAIKADLNNAIIKETVKFEGIAKNAADGTLATASWDGIEAGYDLLSPDFLQKGILLALSPITYLKLVGDKTLADAESTGMVKATMTGAVTKAMAISLDGWVVAEPIIKIYEDRDAEANKTKYAYTVSFGIAPTTDTTANKVAVKYS